MFYSRTDVYKYSFFPYTILEWNKLYKNIQQWPTPKPVYNIHNPTGLKLLTRLTLGLSHLNEHSFNHNLRDL